MSGAFIGALTALQLSNSFWWLGLFVGALVGYFAYQPMEVVRAVPHAWQAAYGGTKTAFKTALPGLWLFLNMCLVFAPLSFLLTILTTSPELMEQPFAMRWLVVATAFCSCFLSVSNLMCASVHLPKGRVKENLQKWNVVNVYFRVLPRAVVWTARHTPVALRALFIELPRILWKFSKYLFVAIHSDVRVLCAVDASFGAAMGWYFGNAIIGALLGGALGFLNYAIVTKRILQIVPRS